MVEELKLEKIYAQRGIELITPAAGARILDRLINQKTPNVIAISADWSRARSAGLGGQLPPMFSELGTTETSPEHADSRIVDPRRALGDARKLTGSTSSPIASSEIVAAVFDLAVTDIGPDDILDDIGLDSMMAMDFRVRIDAMFAIDLPVLELLRGVSVNSLAVRILAELQLADADRACSHRAAVRGPLQADDDVDRLIEQLSDAELRELLAELERLPRRKREGLSRDDPPCSAVRGLSKTYGQLHCGAGSGSRRRLRRDIRDPRAQRCGQVDDHRDPRGPPKARRRAGAGPGRRSRNCGPELARQDRHRAARSQRLRDVDRV